MRRLLLATATSLVALSLHAQEKWIESPVTLALTLTYAGDQALQAGKRDTSIRTIPLVTYRLGNKQILEALVTNGDIPEIQGWSLVAIWAYWPDEDPVAGNTYRFYARKGKGSTLQTVPVPSDILSVAPLVAEVGVRHAIQGEEDTILSGAETYQLYTKLSFASAGIFGDLHGVQIGSGKYVKIAGQDAGRYVPSASKAAINGLFSHDRETAAGVVVGSVSFGAGRFVTSYDYVAPSGTSHGFEGVFLFFTAVTSTAIDETTGSAGLLAIGENGPGLDESPTVTLAEGTLSGSGSVASSSTYSGSLTLGAIAPGQFQSAPAVLDTFSLPPEHLTGFITVDPSLLTTERPSWRFNPDDGTLTVTTP